jgi:hypothetical protein
MNVGTYVKDGPILYQCVGPGLPGSKGDSMVLMENCSTEELVSKPEKAMDALPVIKPKESA